MGIAIHDFHISSQLAAKRKLPPVLMLHGWGQSLNDLKPLAELLSTEREIYLLDLPGFGQSAMPDGDWDTQRYATRVIEYLDEHKITSVVTLGHSFGGRISLRLASQHSDRIDAMILIGSHGLKRKRTLKEQLRIKSIGLLSKTAKQFEQLTGIKIYTEKFVPRFGSIDYRNAGPLRGTLVKTVIEDQTSSLSKIKAPTLLLWGNRDRETPLELGQRFNKLISNSRLIALFGKDHYPHRDIGAHLCAFYIREFLTSLDSGEAG